MQVLENEKVRERFVEGERGYVGVLAFYCGQLELGYMIMAGKNHLSK